MPFADSEDVHAEDILAANHVPLTAEGLQAALDSGVEVLQAAAARVAGARGERAVLDSLRTLAADTSGGHHPRGRRLRAGRLGEPEGLEALIACLALPLDGLRRPGPGRRLARPAGRRARPQVIERALRSSNEIVRAVAVKQLPFFGEQGRPLIEAALDDADPEIARQARILLNDETAP